MKLLNILVMGVLLSIVLSSNVHAVDLQSEAKDKVSQQLLDPSSVDFRNMKIVVNSKGDNAVCGEVNAKNRFGGYVGFKPFSYLNNVVSIVDEDNSESMDKYNLAGCAGPSKELESRLNSEAFFNCNVIWNMIKNVVVNNKTEEEALDSAINAIKQRAQENAGVISPEQEKAIRLAFSAQLAQTLKNKKQVKAIKESSEYQEGIFVPSCTASTESLLKAQVGLK